AVQAVNRLLADRAEVSRLTAPVTAGERTWPAGTFLVSGQAATLRRLREIATGTGVSFHSAAARPAAAVTLRTPRIGLLDVYGGSMTSGWTRWILEQFGFPFERTFPPRVDAGNLNARYDVLIFPSGVLPDPSRPPRFRRDDPPASADDSIEASLPPEYRNQRGRVTAEKTLAAIRRFVEQGGVAIATGSSANALASALDLPVSDHLVADGEPLPRTKFYVPGSIVRARVDATHPLAAGMDTAVDVFFDESPVFALPPDAASRGVTRVAWYEGKAPLRSGWAWGQEALDGGAAVVAASVGKGTVFLFGPEILQRGQPHGTFRFFFNAIYWGTGR
ncbi:MAG TPA: peptidase, partial [Gemmatimonadales bacterium]